MGPIFLSQSGMAPTLPPSLQQLCLLSPQRTSPTNIYQPIRKRYGLAGYIRPCCSKARSWLAAAPRTRLPRAWPLSFAMNDSWSPGCRVAATRFSSSQSRRKKDACIALPVSAPGPQISLDIATASRSSDSAAEIALRYSHQASLATYGNEKAEFGGSDIQECRNNKNETRSELERRMSGSVDHGCRVKYSLVIQRSHPDIPPNLRSSEGSTY